MGSFPRQSLCIALVLLACGQSAFGGTYADPRGFSFTYPDGWVAVTRAVLQDANQDIAAELKEWVAKNDVNLDQLSVVLIRDARAEFLENLNVVVLGQQLPLSDKTLKELIEAIPKQYANSGIKVDGIQGRLDHVGSRHAMVLEYQSRLPGGADPLRQRQVMFPGGGKTFIVTCTAHANSFDQYQPVFDGVLASFQAPAPVAQGFNWNQVFMTGAVGGITGGLVAGLAVAMRAFTGKPRPKPEAPERSEL